MDEVIVACEDGMTRGDVRLHAADALVIKSEEQHSPEQDGAIDRVRAGVENSIEDFVGEQPESGKRQKGEKKDHAGVAADFGRDQE